MGVESIEFDAEKALSEVETKLNNVGFLYRSCYGESQSYHAPFARIHLEQGSRLVVQMNIYSDVANDVIHKLFKESFDKHEANLRIIRSSIGRVDYSPYAYGLNNPPIAYTNIVCENLDELAQLQALLDDFIAKIDNDKKAVTHLFNVAIGHAMHACHKEWEILSQCVGKDYLGYHALGKITNYKTQFENLISIGMMTEETLKRLAVLYDNVEKDFGRADRVTTALWIAAVVVALLFVAMMIIVVFPHFLMLSTAVAGTLFFGGLMGVILTALTFPNGAMSKQREVDAFGGILETKQNNFHRFFGDHTKMDDEKMGEKPPKEEQSTPLLSMTN